MRRLSLYVLRISGVLVFVAGTLHLFMTRPLMHWFSAMTVPHAEVARAAMMLNHIVAGILLLPLAICLAAVGGPLSRGEPWAIAIGISSSVALLALPFVLAFTVRGPMLDAPVFIAAGTMLTLSALGVAAAVAYLWMGAPTSRRSHIPQ